MNEGAPMMYGGGGCGYGGAGVFVLAGQERQSRHYPLDVLQVLGGAAPAPASTRRAPRKERPPRDPRDATAFGYDSDDSSLSSNASGSNKSSEKEGTSRSSERVGSAGGGWGGWGVRGGEWRGRRERRDTRPRHRIAPERYLNAAYPFQVKFTPDELLNGSEWDTLSQEIWEKFVKSQQTEETFRKKMNLWRYLYITIKSIFPRYGLYVVGSTMSGFGLDSSDMDLCLYVRPVDNLEPRAHALLHLNYILSYIKSFDPSLDAELIQAKVPILKFRDARNGLQIDLNCNNVVGIRNTNLLYGFSTMDWRVRPLVALMKLWAQAHNINDARQRTLSSYSLTLMVIQFLQCEYRGRVDVAGDERRMTTCVAGGTVPAVLPRVWQAGCGGWEALRGTNRFTLAELFLHLLRYYAEFPWDKMAVSVRLGRPVAVAECRCARAHKNDPHQWKLLCVEEPFDLTNTARSVYDPDEFERIVRTFRLAHQRLAATRRLADAWPQQAPAAAPLR
ncbi:poly(A) RNA polymerase gld-2 homolog A-like isoform X3 [Hyposmocoma kahamanoa]|uniref:poly(A) RNA polymerase gld-2 homolog A-like isoform X3 n=1 Tax=Hyposmocoma kahamanoa TaxID=1477025 RepID=UPI000E6D679F|nr:poly(A) RNA polymerase gld-2 homolog A-like isoform X3 [Hyposmocoma kahamanoa]